MYSFDIHQQTVSNPLLPTHKRPVVLTIAASDSSGCAGIVVDIKCQQAFGVHSAMAITANTAQTNRGVLSINLIDEKVFDDQIQTAFAQTISAIKIGLLSSSQQIKIIVNQLKQSDNHIPMIIDPVIQSSSGALFLDASTLDFYKKNLLSHCDLLTPNLHELTALTGQKISSFNDIEIAAKHVLTMGVKSVLVKGGHSRDFDMPATDFVQDFFTNGKESFWLANQFIKAKASRGTGCAMASSIAASLALGYSIYDAVVIGKMAINQGLRHSYWVNDAKEHYGPVDIDHFPMSQIDLPFLSLSPVLSDEFSFPKCNEKLLGLYPVVDRAKWLKRLAPAGVTTIQLRVKDLKGEALKREIQAAVHLSRELSMRLFINDYWELAIECGAYGVHLGQEDIDSADINRIYEAGLRLGLSTHCHYEVARAHRYRPSYIACGPVFHTNTKDMPWVPHGLKGLHYWREVLDYPLVAIGGINQERFNSVAELGVDSIAMITAITLADDPIKTAADFIERLSQKQRVFE